MAQSRASTARVVDLRDYLPQVPGDHALYVPALEQVPDDLASQVSATKQDNDDYWSQPPPSKEERERRRRPSRARLKTTAAHDAIFNRNVAPVHHEPLFSPEAPVLHAPLFPVNTSSEAKSEVPQWLANGKVRFDEKRAAVPVIAEESAPISSSAPGLMLDQEALWEQLGHHATSATEQPPAFSGWVTVTFPLGCLATAFLFSLGYVGFDPYIAFLEEAGSLAVWLFKTGQHALASF